MSSLILKSLGNRAPALRAFGSTLLSKNVGVVEVQRMQMSYNEEQWLKEYSKKLLDDTKKEKGIDLKLDPSKPQLFFENSEEYKSANETVKKLLSLAFAKKEDYKRWEEDSVRKIFQQLPVEKDSLEIKIALLTLNIKRIVRFLDENGGNVRRAKFILYRQIHRRDRYLTQLFFKDNKRYEWIKSMIGLEDYEPRKPYPYQRFSKYDKFISEVTQEAENARLAKMNQHKEKVEAEKELFFQERNKILAEIQKDIAALGFKDLKFPSLDGNK